MAINVHGPVGSGKTFNQALLLRLFGLERAYDHGSGPLPSFHTLQENDLVFSNFPVPDFKGQQFHITEALAMAKKAYP